jgi:hypothetical protein
MGWITKCYLRGIGASVGRGERRNPFRASSGASGRSAVATDVNEFRCNCKTAVRVCFCSSAVTAHAVGSRAGRMPSVDWKYWFVRGALHCTTVRVTHFLHEAEIGYWWAELADRSLLPSHSRHREVKRGANYTWPVSVEWFRCFTWPVSYLSIALQSFWTLAAFPVS